jgi:hypothetical protein
MFNIGIGLKPRSIIRNHGTQEAERKKENPSL